ncbi:MAG: hypothetical protein IJS15_14810 [Victivallales bacterium]|nr:hypothetical protein [Victivallales bacterium]
MTREHTLSFRGWMQASRNTAAEEDRYAECSIDGFPEIDKEVIRMKT